MNCLRPDNAIYIMQSQNLKKKEEKWDVEKWYNT